MPAAAHSARPGWGGAPPPGTNSAAGAPCWCPSWFHIRPFPRRTPGPWVLAPRLRLCLGNGSRNEHTALGKPSSGPHLQTRPSVDGAGRRRWPGAHATPGPHKPSCTAGFITQQAWPPERLSPLVVESRALIPRWWDEARETPPAEGGELPKPRASAACMAPGPSSPLSRTTERSPG